MPNHSQSSLVFPQSKPHQAWSPPFHSQASPCSSTSPSCQTRANPRAKDEGLPVSLAADHAWLEELPRDPSFGTKRELRQICMVCPWPSNHPTDLRHHPVPTWRAAESDPRLESLNPNQQMRCRGPWLSCWGDTFPGTPRGLQPRALCLWP